jgi:hypothetical protein
VRVETKPHLPGNPRAKGQVENRNNFVEGHFETRLKFEPVNSVAELNAAAERWCAGINANMIEGCDYRFQRAGRYYQSRLVLWQMIAPDQLVELPDAETCRLLLTHEPVRRTLDNTLSFTYAYPGLGRRVYQMQGSTGVEVGDEVQVQPILVEAEPIVLVRWKTGGDWGAVELAPVAVDAAGFDVEAPVFGESYKRHADTAAGQAGKDMKVLAYGTMEPKKNAVPFAAFNGGQGMKAHSFIDPQVDIAPRRLVGRPVDVGMDIVTAHDISISALEAVKRVKARAGWIPEGYLARIKAEYPNGVPVGVVDDLAQEILEPASGPTLRIYKEA